MKHILYSIKQWHGKLWRIWWIWTESPTNFPFKSWLPVSYCNWQRVWLHSTTAIADTSITNSVSSIGAFQISIIHIVSLNYTCHFQWMHHFTLHMMIGINDGVWLRSARKWWCNSPMSFMPKCSQNSPICQNSPPPPPPPAFCAIQYSYLVL